MKVAPSQNTVGNQKVPCEAAYSLLRGGGPIATRSPTSRISGRRKAGSTLPP